MVVKFLNQLKPILTKNQNVIDIVNNISQVQDFYPIIFITLVSTFILNYLFFILFKNVKKYSTIDGITFEKTRLFSFKELSVIFSFYLTLTILAYIKVILKINSHIFAIGGDSFNHYARLVESKNILTNKNLSIFHWPGIFFPDGLTAFDGAPTLINDVIYLTLSPFFNSLFIYNFIHLSTYPLAGLFTYILVKEVTKKMDLAFFSGAIFAFSQQHIHASHLWLNITHIELIPLIIWLYIQLKKPDLLKIILTSLILTILGYQSLYFIFFIYMFIGLFFLLPEINKNKKLFLINLTPILISLAFLSFWLIPMLKDPTVEKSKYMPHIFFNADLAKVFFGTSIIFNDFKTNPQFIGFPILVAAILSMIKKLNSYTINIVFLFLSIIALGTTLRINGDLIPSILPEIFLTILPAYKSMRSTDRYMMFLMIPLSIMAFNTINFYIKNKYLKIGILFFLFITQFSFNDQIINVNPPEIYSQIPEKPNDDFGIIEFPLNNPMYWMWRATHKYNIVYGYLFIRGRKDKFFHQLHKKIINNEFISIAELKEKKVKYIISHIGNQENLYADIFGNPSRENKQYFGVEQYINNSDLKNLKKINEINNKILYLIE